MITLAELNNLVETAKKAAESSFGDIYMEATVEQWENKPPNTIGRPVNQVAFTTFLHIIDRIIPNALEQEFTGNVTAEDITPKGRR